MNINKILDAEFNKEDLISVNLQTLLKVFIKNNIKDYNNIDAIESDFRKNSLIIYMVENLKDRYNVSIEKVLGKTKEKEDCLKIIELKLKDEKTQDTIRVVNYIESSLILISSNRQDPFKTQVQIPVAENFTNIIMLKLDKSKKLQFQHLTQRINCDEWFSGDYTLTKLDLTYKYNFLNNLEEIDIMSDKKNNLILGEIAFKIKDKELLNEEFFDLLTLTSDAHPQDIQKIKPIINAMLPENKNIVELNFDIINTIKKTNNKVNKNKLKL